MLLVSGTPGLAGDINGRNTVFEAQKVISQDAIVSINGLSRAPGDATSNGYRLDGKQVRLQEPLVTGDILTVYLPPEPVTGIPLVVQPGSPRPQPLSATALTPSGSAAAKVTAASGSATALRPTIGAATTTRSGTITGTAQRT